MISDIFNFNFFFINFSFSVKSYDQEVEEQAGRRKRSSAIANTTEILTKLGYVSNSFEYFVRKVDENRQTQSDLILTGKLLSAITNFASNFDKKMKLFNMGVVDSILAMVSNNKIEDSIKFGGFEFLAKVFLEKKIIWKYKKIMKAIVKFYIIKFIDKMLGHYRKSRR